MKPGYKNLPKKVLVGIFFAAVVTRAIPPLLIVVIVSQFGPQSAIEAILTRLDLSLTQLYAITYGVGMALGAVMNLLEMYLIPGTSDLLPEIEKPTGGKA